MLLISCVSTVKQSNNKKLSEQILPREIFFEKIKCADIIPEQTFNTIFQKSDWIVEDRFFVSNGACRFLPFAWKETGCNDFEVNECDKWKGVDSTKLIECSKNRQTLYKEKGCDKLNYFSISIAPYRTTDEYSKTLKSLRAQIGTSSRMLIPSEVKGKLVESNTVGSYYFDFDVQESISARFITTDKRFYVTLLFMPVISEDNSFNRESIAKLASIIDNNLVIWSLLPYLPQ